MKKFLSLVMALIMTMSLVTVASAADYKDAADIDCTEAVEVMSAVGVFQGADGKFSPKANLTREQAAKLIAYLDLGEKAAEALPAVQAFSDVPATRWSAKYVAYCADAGYINGVGNGKFNPAGELTGYAFGKMLLCTLGFDASIEAFTGANWTIAVAKLMNSNDINDGVKTSPAATLTREAAAQYCLNTLKADVVKYDKKGTQIIISDAVISTGASAAEKDTKYADLADKLYGKDLKKTTGTDDFKAPATTWKYKNEEVGTYVDAPDATYNSKVRVSTIYNLLGKSVVEDLTKGNGTLTVITDGKVCKFVKETDPITYDKGETTLKKEQAKIDDIKKTDEKAAKKAQAALDAEFCNIKSIDAKDSSAKAFGTDYGTVTEIYIDDDGVKVKDNDVVVAEYAKVTVIVKNTYVMKAKADYNAKTEKLSVGNKIGPFSGSLLKADDFAAVADLKKDDYILYTYANSKVQTIEKAELLTGKIDGYKVGSNIVLDGVDYNYSVACKDTYKSSAYEIGETATVVLDSMGYIIYVHEAKQSNDDVVYVAETAKNGFINQAKIVTVDGKKLTVTVKDGSDVDIGDDLVKGFYAYSVKDGEYKLTNYTKKGGSFTVNGVDAENPKEIVTAFANKQTSLNGNTANSKTVYIVKDSKGDITLYTGVKNAPTVKVLEGTKVFYVVNNTTDNELLYVYVEAAANGIDEPNTNDDTLVYVLEKCSKKYVDKDENEYVEVTVLMDGVEKTLKVDADAAEKEDSKFDDDAGTLYTKLKTNSDGFVIDADEASGKWGKISNVSALSFKDDVVTLTYGGKHTETAFVKTDKVTLVVFGGDLKSDANADYELPEVTTMEGVETFINGYNVTMSGYVKLNDDGDVVDMYVAINDSTKN